MTPAFSNASVRNFTQIFFDSAYKVKDAWDESIATSLDGEAIIDVQNWMNHISLDSIGVAGFSHDFGALAGQKSEMVDILDSFGSSDFSKLQEFIFVLALEIPILSFLPNKRNSMRQRLSEIMGEIAEKLLLRTSDEKKLTGDYKYSPGQSIIGALSTSMFAL